jgi:hypothetical protein
LVTRTIFGERSVGLDSRGDRTLEAGLGLRQVGTGAFAVGERLLRRLHLPADHLDVFVLDFEHSLGRDHAEIDLDGSEQDVRLLRPGIGMGGRGAVFAGGDVGGDAPTLIKGLIDA